MAPMTVTTTYRLVRPTRAAVTAPRLDDAQRRVVEHPGGPLLVLAGPGTGKTTTLVETAVARVEAGVPIEQLLMLTFGRRAAGELRDRVTARLGGTVREPVARTFHSYAFGVLRMAAVAAQLPAPRLLSGPEQDVILRELVGGDTSRWPAALRPALGTRAFAGELRDLLLRAVERGLDGPRLAALGRARRRDEWVAAGDFLQEYLDVTSLARPGAWDPAELIRAATDVLIIVGDPDQSIYAFRGADPSAIPDRFGELPVVALGTSRRAGSTLLAATRRVAMRLPGRGEHRELSAVHGAPPGRVDVALLRSAAEEASYVAAMLRGAHLDDELPWSRMAVLVRSTTTTLAVLRRALVAAGVPVAVPGSDVPLAEQPAVAHLLTALRCVLRPDELTEDLAEHLLLGPIGRADALQLRRLRRELRASGDGQLAPTLLDEPGAGLLPERVRRPVPRVASVLAAGRRAPSAGASAEDVLWAVWHATGLAYTWESASLAGGPGGAAADRDLDSVIELFEAAARFTDRQPGAPPERFFEHLEAQQVPGESRPPSPVRSEAVQVLTAHAGKGLEWDLVVVAHVQEGVWPDLRRRGTLLGS